MRIVLAAERPDDWKIYRQRRWMGLVRDRPEAAGWPRRHFDLDDPAHAALAARWEPERLGRSAVAAVAAIAGAGGVEIVGPS